LRFPIPEHVVFVIRRLQTSGGQAFVVGGAIRDLLREREPKDYDVTTDWLPEDVIRLFPELKIVLSGLRHGTVSLLIPQSCVDKDYTSSVEITTFRQDGIYSDGRRPDSVSFVSDVRSDLARRDFTINAIAYDPLADQLIDPFDGQSDINKEMIRAVGDPVQRFAEDSLRMMRAVRFASELNYRVESRTYRAIQQSAGDVNRVSAERIQMEFNKIVMSFDPARSLRLMADTGLMAEVYPEVENLRGCKQRERDEEDLFDQTLSVCDIAPPELPIRLAALFHNIGKPRTASISINGERRFPRHEQVGADLANATMSRLKYARAMTTRVAFLVRHHLFVFRRTGGDAELLRLIAVGGVQAVKELAALQESLDRVYDLNSNFSQRSGDITAHLNHMVEHGIPFTVRELAINGSDIMSMLALPPGPDIGKWLGQLLELVQQERLSNKREALLNYVKIVAKRVDID